MPRITLIACLLLLVGCSPIAPDSIDVAIIENEWAIAQEVLSKWSPDVYKVGWSRFSWKAYDGSFQCGGVEANGCYHNPGGVISWNRNTPGVIRHEAGHAIVHTLGHPCGKYVSLDGWTVTYHKHVGEDAYCRSWIDGIWGED